ncbi:MAG TPA: cyanophycinase [Nitrosomonas sp.]|nr:cyanophycinase [Nitrosomonas sp.]HQX14074.1 cyanophycinase [Nitrosomonas sp.]HRB31621.1 cyanophycinase [Nitrosomonas sp.]
MKKFCLFLILIMLFLSGSAIAAKKKPPYDYFRIGSLVDASNIQPTRGTVMMGGSSDVDEAFKWMCALSGNGDFLIIRARGTDDFNSYIRQLCPNSNSVATLIIPSVDAANDEFVVEMINAAEAIWISGGDQSNYINFWTNTLLHSALKDRIVQGIPLGGNSAGLDVLTQFIYSALLNKGTISTEALADPFNKYITLDNQFDLKIPYLEGIIGDAHVVARDRMGRDLAFLCRVYDAGWAPLPRGITVDEHTALLIDANGQATVAGISNAYFLTTTEAPETCQKDTPLTYKNINVYRVTAQGTFDLANWVGQNGTAYSVSAENGVLISTQPNQSPY